MRSFPASAGAIIGPVKRALLVFLALAPLTCANAQVFRLPPPQKTGGMPLMDALAIRHTERSFDTQSLSSQQISDLLWAAFGVNRPDGKRTAPSAMNNQEVDVYVLLRSGAYRYAPSVHGLEVVAEGDLRASGGTQDFVKDAPVTLVFVADLSRMGKVSLDQRKLLAEIDTGYISQNVYLYCASEGLVTGARASFDAAALKSKLGLKDDQFIVLAQSVGHPKPAEGGGS